MNIQDWILGSTRPRSVTELDEDGLRSAEANRFGSWADHEVTMHDLMVLYAGPLSPLVEEADEESNLIPLPRPRPKPKVRQAPQAPTKPVQNGRAAMRDALGALRVAGDALAYAERKLGEQIVATFGQKVIDLGPVMYEKKRVAGATLWVAGANQKVIQVARTTGAVVKL